MILLLIRLIAAQSACSLFDSFGNLHIFGSNGDKVFTNDFSSAIALLSDNRPTFNGQNLVCIPSYNLNAAYFLNADKDSSLLYEFKFQTKSWRSITIIGTGPNMSKVHAVMDYDTLVIYAFGDGFYRLGNADLDNVSKNPSSLTWIQANTNPTPFDDIDYIPTFGHACFHMYFFGVKGTKPGSVWGFRTHFGEWGLQQQFVGSDFPNLPGKTATFTFKYPEQFEHGGAPSHVSFIPNDYSGVYVVNSYVNTTIKVAAPSKEKSSEFSMYCASDSKLVQYTPDTGLLQYMDFSWLAQKQENTNESWKESPVKLDPVRNLNPKVGSNNSPTASNPSETPNSSNYIRNYLTLLALFFII